MMYGQNAIAVNEFLGKSWSHVSKKCNHIPMSERSYIYKNTNMTYEEFRSVFDNT